MPLPPPSPQILRQSVLALVVPLLAVCGGERPAVSTAEAWHLREDLRVGSLEGAIQFANVTDVWADGDGRIWVADGPPSAIRIFGPDGTLLRQVATEGEGPGEVGLAMALEAAPDGTVWVADSRNHRFEVFSRTGEYVASYPYVQGMYRFGDRWGTDGLLYTNVMLPGTNPPQLALVRRQPAEGRLPPLDTLPVPPTDLGRTVNARIIRNGIAMNMPVPVPFQALRLTYLVAGEGWWLSHPGDRFRLAFTDLRGDTLRILEASFESVPVSADDRAEVLARLVPGLEIPVSEIPDHHPPVSGLAVLPDGHLLVRRRAPDGDVLEVFDVQDRHVATLPLPPRFQLHTATDSALYGVVRDDLDVPFVVRLALER